ncbi:MAG: DUF4335 domain-containing protein [Elainellaceae cyanobacterium]
MTIQRQYSLPNCKLVLEGWEDGSSSAASVDGRPLLSMVANVECYLAGHDKPLSGGREFLDSLARVTNRYAQEFLSGVPRPANDGDRANEMVEIHRIEGDRHRLTVHTPAGENGLQPPSEEAKDTQSVDLLTVQLFDLVEAIDQMVADVQTLPTVSLNLTPVPRRFARAQEPKTERAVPAAIGVSSLAAVAIAFFFIPPPEFRIPEPEPVQDELLDEGAAPSGLNGDPPALDPVAPPDTDESAAIDAAPTDPPAADAGLEEDGEAAVDADGDTPVEPDLPIEDGDAEEDPDDVSAASTSSPTQSSPVAVSRQAREEEMSELLETAPLIAEPEQVDGLTAVLRDRIADAWNEPAAFEEDLVYRVGVAESGDIVGFRYVNDAALDYIDETPLLDLVVLPTEAIAAGEEPIGQFRVVFTADGVIQVSPWYGRPSE